MHPAIAYISYSHKQAGITQTLSAYEDVTSIIKSTLDKNELKSSRKGNIARSVYKVIKPSEKNELSNN